MSKPLPEFAKLGFSAIGNLALVAGPVLLLDPFVVARVDGFIAAALCALSLAVVLEVHAQRDLGDRVAQPSCGSEAAIARRLNMVQGAALLLTLQVTLLSSSVGREPSMPTYIRVSGCAFIVAGALLRYTSIRTLRAAFTDGFACALPERVTTGPYRYIAHPAELGLLAIAAGFIVVLALPRLAMAPMAILAATSLFRVRGEEKALASSSTIHAPAGRGRP